jgi:hypothetical protein
MLRIKVEIVPGGAEWKAKPLGSINIENRGTVDGIASYAYHLSDNDGKDNISRIDGHKRSDGFWVLLRLILEREAHLGRL